MNVAEFRDLLATPYEVGGRIPGIAIDCLGVVGEVARRIGLPAPDGWHQIKQAIAEGRPEAATGFPAGWHPVPRPWTIGDGDVLLYWGEHPWCAIVHGGYVFGASRMSGAYCFPLARWHRDPAEVWRFTA